MTFRIERSPKLSEFKVSYRRRTGRASGRTKVKTPIISSQSAADYLRTVWNHDTLELLEEFYVICLDSSNSPMGWIRVSSGGLDATSVDPRLIFAVALKAAATGIIVAHNHPSGGLTPSEEDKRVTKRLKEGANLLAIRFLDHIILTGDSAFSFADNGLL